MVELYEHQKLGKSFLLKEKKACLFFEVGTGKTFTALSALTEIPKKSKVLIVAPKRVLTHVWLTQTEYDLSDWDVTYTNYELISRRTDIVNTKFDCIILDECHKVKGKGTKVSNRIKSATSKAQWVWGLTGTPIANNYIDIYNIFKNMNIVEFNMSYTEFCETYYYCRPLEKGMYSIMLPIAPKTWKLDELMYRVSEHAMVKEAKDCIELPEKTVNVHYIEGMNNDKYKELYNGIYKFEINKTLIKLEAINKAHQAANGYVYNTAGLTEHIMRNKKLDKLHDLCDMYLEESDKIILVYWYKQDMSDIFNELKNDYVITTDISTFTNDKDTQILLLQFGQAEGLNLQFCNRMIFYTFDYSFLKYDQMCGRIYRSGQKNNVIYDILLAANTIEEKIWKAVRNKESIDEFLKGALKEDGGLESNSI